MSDVTVAVEGVERSVPAGTTVAELFGSDRSVVVARVDGVLVDLATELADGARVEGVKVDSPEGRSVLRHSTAHVLAQAVQDLFPQALLGIGPPIENGFYYDFDVARRFTRTTCRGSRSGCRRSSRPGSGSRAASSARTTRGPSWRSEPYKLELIGLKGPGQATEDESAEVGGAELTIYDNLDAKTGERVWWDLCRGPHVPTTRHIPAFKLHAHRGRVLAGEREEPAAAAHLRHRVGVQGRAQGAPGGAGRGGAARPPQARHRAGPVLLPGRDRLRARGVPPEGRDRPARDGGLLPAAARGGRVRVRLHPAHHQGRRCSRPPATSTGTRTGCTRRWSWTRRSTTTAPCAGPRRSTT